VAFRQQNVDVRGARITLKRGGEGRKLLYLHGANGAPSVRPFMEMLAQSYEVLVPEHPGFGGSDEPEWLDTIHDLAYFYLDFIEQLDLRDVHLVGSSLGGWLALEVAIRDRTRLRALTAVGPLGIYVAGVKRGDMFLWSPEEKVRNLFHDQRLADQILAQPATPDQAELEVKNLHTVARLAWEPRMFDPHLAKWLHRIKLPTQIIWGEHDKVLPPAYAAEFQKLIPGARVDIVKQCGHLPHTEKPEEFTRLVREFGK
jgi:pimeloyl-ACP methyl ester carboxylesterase